jgi:hypothetical protein
MHTLRAGNDGDEAAVSAMRRAEGAQGMEAVYVTRPLVVP